MSQNTASCLPFLSYPLVQSHDSLPKFISIIQIFLLCVPLFASNSTDLKYNQSMSESWTWMRSQGTAHLAGNDCLNSFHPASEKEGSLEGRFFLPSRVPALRNSPCPSTATWSAPLPTPILCPGFPSLEEVGTFQILSSYKSALIVSISLLLKPFLSSQVWDGSSSV